MLAKVGKPETFALKPQPARLGGFCGKSASRNGITGLQNQQPNRRWVV
jgi:hypothetical protein